MTDFWALQGFDEDCGWRGKPSSLRAPCALCHIVNQEVRELRAGAGLTVTDLKAGKLGGYGGLMVKRGTFGWSG